MQLDNDRSLLVRAVLQGQVDAELLTEADILDLELQSMELIADSREDYGCSVFSDYSTLQ